MAAEFVVDLLSYMTFEEATAPAPAAGATKRTRESRSFELASVGEDKEKAGAALPGDDDDDDEDVEGGDDGDSASGSASDSEFGGPPPPPPPPPFNVKAGFGTESGAFSVSSFDDKGKEEEELESSWSFGASLGGFLSSSLQSAEPSLYASSTSTRDDIGALLADIGSNRERRQAAPGMIVCVCVLRGVAAHGECA